MNVTQRGYTADELFELHKIAISFACISSIILLITIVTVATSFALSIYTRRRQQSFDIPLECNVFLVHETGEVAPVTAETPPPQVPLGVNIYEDSDTTLSRMAPGENIYEDMSHGGLSTDNIYEIID
ncbi:b135 [Murid betaherpesvirus 8]|uniref:B135 n=1 Tax=Rat cytomegalovirus (isolate England) TaxID=1261657 RepID=A0A0E3X3L4_RCMVE|nr:b135 [Murid betaherpesvirus 8]WPH25032.1 b135 [Murid betaherpesvirus 8]WPH25166.1 b135 [Murid betaherpesvirus 8]